jgi:hypothetical protein
MHYTAEETAIMRSNFVNVFLGRCLMAGTKFPAQADIEAYYDRAMSVDAALDDFKRRSGGEFDC